MKIKPIEKEGGVIMELGPQEPQLPSQSCGETPSVLPSFKLKKILVPVELSECTKEALLYAVPLAKQFDAELTLLHVVEAAYGSPTDTGVVPEVETTEDAEKELKRLRDQIGGAVRCRSLVREGAAEFEIIEAAKETAADLIILSTHGRTGFARLLMGSTAERVVRHAGCPLLVVRPNEREFVASEESEWQPDDNAAEKQVEAEMTAGV